jgi:hypothetical protein
MDFVPKEEIKELMRKTDEFCVSVFLPTHRVGREIEQDLIRLDNLLRKAKKELTGRGMRLPEAREMLGPAVDLMKRWSFTRHQADGLSMFIARDLFRYFRVPIHFDEHLMIGRQFYLKPLMPILNSGRRFLILAVSQKSVRLFDCTEFGLNEITLEGVPHGLREALGYEEDESRLLFRSVAQGGGTRGVSTFHGHGGGTEVNKEDLRHYFLKLKDALHPYLNDIKIPLVFAGVEYLFPFFKETNVYPNTISEAVIGNPDGFDPSALLKHAMETVSPYFERDRETVIERYTDLLGSPLASDRIAQIVEGAFAGRVDALLMDTAAHKWGAFDPGSGSVKIHDQQEQNDEDLLDLAATQTFLNGGNVFAFPPGQMPGQAKAAAIFRY